MNKSFPLILFFFLFFFTTINATETQDKGYYAIQFSWHTDSYSPSSEVKITYKRKGFLNKTQSSITVTKNKFVTLELEPGEYELKDIRLNGGNIPVFKYLKIPLTGSFTIEKGKITNGGLIYLMQENKQSNKVMTLKINNTPDLFEYAKTYLSQKNLKADDIVPAWSFLKNDVVDKLIQSFAELLVKRESPLKRPNVTYLHTTLGMIIKMKKDVQGIVTDYELIPTNTYQQIMKMTLKSDQKYVCDLENGLILYGSDAGLQYAPMPNNVEKTADFHELKNNQYLLVDDNYNIAWADSLFTWHTQSEFRHEQKTKKAPPGALFSSNLTEASPFVYMGKKHIYVYSKPEFVASLSKTAKVKRNILLQSNYENIHFKPIDLPEDLKKIPLVTETFEHLMLGPFRKSHYNEKKLAYIYIKKLNSDSWEIRELPKNYCTSFYPNKTGEILFTECTKGNWFESFDNGLTWSKWKPKSKSTIKN